MKTALIFTLFPTPALAHGEEILVLVYLQSVLLVAVLVSLFSVKIKTFHKAIVFVIYAALNVIAFYATSYMNYLQNSLLINTIDSLVPALGWIISLYIFVKRKRMN